MTRNDFYRYAKIYGLAILGALPFLILTGVFLSDKIAMWLLVVIDSVILLIAFMIAMVLADKHRQHIEKKREAFLKKKQEAEEQEILQKQQKLEAKEKQVEQETNAENDRKLENERRKQQLKNKKYGKFNQSKKKNKK